METPFERLINIHDSDWANTTIIDAFKKITSDNFSIDDIDIEKEIITATNNTCLAYAMSLNEQIPTKFIFDIIDKWKKDKPSEVHQLQKGLLTRKNIEFVEREFLIDTLYRSSFF